MARSPTLVETLRRRIPGLNMLALGACLGFLTGVSPLLANSQWLAKLGWAAFLPALVLLFAVIIVAERKLKVLDQPGGSLPARFRLVLVVLGALVPLMMVTVGFSSPFDHGERLVPTYRRSADPAIHP